MGLLSLPNELVCHIAEEFLDDPADIFALLRGSNRRLAPALTTILNSRAITRKYALNATLWAAFHQHRDLLSLLIKEGEGIQICHPPYLSSNAAHRRLLDYAMDNSRSLRVRTSPTDEYRTMLQWAISSPAHVRLERAEEIVRSGVRYGEEVFHQIVWGPSGHGSDEDFWDRMDSATLDLLLRHLPAGRLSEILLSLYHAGVIPILEATVAGHVRVVKTLLEYGVSPDVGDEDGGFTALHLAVRYGHLGLVRLLLDYGADIGRRDMKRKTPLYYAVSMDRIEMVYLLVLRELEGIWGSDEFGFLNLR